GVVVARREARAEIALVERDRLAVSVGVELPGVIGTDDALTDIAAAVAVEHRAAMRAAVVEHAHRAVGMADHDHRLAADLDRPVVAGILHLALVTDVGPHLVEDAFQLELEDAGIGIDAAVDAIGLHRLAQIQADIASHQDLPRCADERTVMVVQQAIYPGFVPAMAPRAAAAPSAAVCAAGRAQCAGFGAS